MHPIVTLALSLFCSLIIGVNAYAGNTNSLSCQGDINIGNYHCNDASTGSNALAEKNQYAYDSDVLQVQQMLSKLGYNSGHADGIYGPKTKKAIEKFQFENGFMINDQITLLLIYRLKLKLSEQ
ncbi:peptidoglycan-binding domain-containing protein [Marinomonas gallaica]|uniref:peptidoglycan-binding domain-containing protein n=1 Tax=Marinomonas gallaica TaxID=1806667 RepID=UPI0009EDA6B7|nr:peptidoglycan-binding domain-containing protein [Marinomonas gallaica]